MTKEKLYVSVDRIQYALTSAELKIIETINLNDYIKKSEVKEILEGMGRICRKCGIAVGKEHSKKYGYEACIISTVSGYKDIGYNQALKDAQKQIAERLDKEGGNNG